jgi:hypothetical protein
MGKTKVGIFSAATAIAVFIGVTLAVYFLTDGGNDSTKRTDCKDAVEGEWNVMEKKSTCSEIGLENPDWCETQDIVSQNCEKTCGILSGECEICVDSIESFFVWGELGYKDCDMIAFRPSNCEKEPYQKNCPMTCDMCSREQFDYMQCQDNTKCCNGLESNCVLHLDEMLFPTVHNAMHDDLPFQNHNKPLEDALEAGYRGLQLDLCKCGDSLIFCHGNCRLGKCNNKYTNTNKKIKILIQTQMHVFRQKGRRNVEIVVENIIDFLEQNPSEVIVIVLEISVGDPTPKELWTLIQDLEGVTDRVYQHDGSDTWPTMGKLVDSGERLIIFQHNGPKCQDPEEGVFDFDTMDDACHSRILDLYYWTVETEFDFDSVEEIEDSASSCIGTRGWNMTNGGFYSVNNFVSPFYGPSKSSSSKINKKEFLLDRIADCQAVGKKEPNFINIDYWQEGDLVEVTHEINKARALDKKAEKYTALRIPNDGNSDLSERGVFLGY